MCAVGTHFCICLVLLVLSMLVSIVLTRVAQDGYLVFCCSSRESDPKNTGDKEEQGNEGEEDLTVKQILHVLSLSGNIYDIEKQFHA